MTVEKKIDLSAMKSRISIPGAVTPTPPLTEPKNISSPIEIGNIETTGEEDQTKKKISIGSIKTYGEHKKQESIQSDIQDNSHGKEATTNSTHTEINKQNTKTINSEVYSGEILDLSKINLIQNDESEIFENYSSDFIKKIKKDTTTQPDQKQKKENTIQKSTTEKISKKNKIIADDKELTPEEKKEKIEHDALKKYVQKKEKTKKKLMLLPPLLVTLFLLLGVLFYIFPEGSSVGNYRISMINKLFPASEIIWNQENITIDESSFIIMSGKETSGKYKGATIYRYNNIIFIEQKELIDYLTSLLPQNTSSVTNNTISTTEDIKNDINIDKEKKEKLKDALLKSFK